jgi:hypothetical protein
VKPATPLALGLVGKVDHCSRNTSGVSTSAMTSPLESATRSERRLARNADAATAQ